MNSKHQPPSLANVRRLPGGRPSNRIRGMNRAQSGSLGGQRGGSQRARTLSTHQRQEIARKGGRAKNR